MAESKYLNNKLRIFLIQASKSWEKLMKTIKYCLKMVKYFRHNKITVFIRKILKINKENLINKEKVWTKEILLPQN